MKRRIPVLLLIVVLGICFADQEPITKIVSASRYVTDYPNSEVLSPQDVQTFKDNTAADVLQCVPGIEVCRYGGKSAISSIFVQGANSNQSLVMLNGVPLKNTVYGSVDLNNLNLDQIEQVEVYRGGISAVYGADAVGGAINLISSTEPLNRTMLSLDAGSYNNQNVKVQNSGGDPDNNYQLSYWHGRYDGDRPVSYFNNDNLMITSRMKVLGNGYVRLFGAGYTDAVGNPGSLLYPGTSEQQDKGYLLQTILGFGAEGHESSKVYYVTRGDERRAVAGSITDSNGWTNTLGGMQALNWGDHAVLLGIDSNQMIPHDSALLQNTTILNTGYYLNDDWSVLKGTRLNVGVRRDSHSTFGTADTYKVSAVMDVLENCMLKSSYGTSFKAPTLSDLYFQDAWGDVGNPNLRPETAKNADIELSMKTSLGNARVSYFQKDVSNLIVWGAAADYSSSSPNNVGQAKLSGYEVEVEGKVLGGGMYNINYATLINANDQSTGQWLSYRAKNKASLRLSLPTILGQISSRTNYISERCSSTGGAFDLPAYWVTDLDFTRDMVSLYIHNVFNQAYQEINGYPMPGRTYGVKVSIGL